MKRKKLVLWVVELQVASFLDRWDKPLGLAKSFVALQCT